MANQLGMAEQHSIITLWKRGSSHRRTARTLGIHRETVSLYVRLAAEVAIDASQSQLMQLLAVKSSAFAYVVSSILVSFLVKSQTASSQSVGGGAGCGGSSAIFRTTFKPLTGHIS